MFAKLLCTKFKLILHVIGSQIFEAILIIRGVIV